VQEEDMTCLMNYREAELSEFQSPLLESRARVEREQISALHDRWVWVWVWVLLNSQERYRALREWQCGPRGST